jgi:starch phosphorylase
MGFLDRRRGQASPTPGAQPAAAPDPDALRASILSKLTYSLGKTRETATPRDWFAATALATRDHLIDRWMATDAAGAAGRRVYYLSLEFLVGRLLRDNLSNLGLLEPVRRALEGLGLDLEIIRAIEPDAALGNGGLGRLAACFMDSMATLAIPAVGYGIRYDHGLFKQRFEEGWQREEPETWLVHGNPWEFERIEAVYVIEFGGSVQSHPDDPGEFGRCVWRPAEIVEAVAYDTPVAGWRGRHVNTLRLWSARAPEPLHLAAFNEGDHVGARIASVKSDAISKVLYPGDHAPAGQELRLRQEYFFVSASLQDLIRRHIAEQGDVRTLADHAAIQLNDTHPAIAVPELMRLLVDVHGVPWDEAWAITQRTFSYTNHTLLPEALETWPVQLMEWLLPRHLQIIYLINGRHLDRLRRAGEHDGGRLAAVSLIGEGYVRNVRMGHLAFLGSHKVNGVSALHTDLMRSTVFSHLNALFPDRIVNKTNGITFRRWLHQANPGLTAVLADVAGPAVLDDPSLLRRIEPMAASSSFHQRLAAARRDNKQRLAATIREAIDVVVDPGALFDVHIKRIHEYKRQLLNIIETIALYEAIRATPSARWVPRVKIFAGKAAASYQTAKLIIKLINDVARVVNTDPLVGDRLKVAYLPNYNVSLAEAIIPAADLSEQISTAGMEASGTGNMKLALNGALTIGTLDGANVEMREHVGAENIFIFGLTAAEVAARRQRGIDASEAIAASPRLEAVLAALARGDYSPDDPNRYRGLVHTLRHHDHFMVCFDFDAYWTAQRRIDALWLDPASWWQKSVLNTARMGWFSSDRTIREYADDIWRVAGGS